MVNRRWLLLYVSPSLLEGKFKRGRRCGSAVLILFERTARAKNWQLYISKNIIPFSCQEGVLQTLDAAKNSSSDPPFWAGGRNPDNLQNMLLAGTELGLTNLYSLILPFVGTQCSRTRTFSTRSPVQNTPQNISWKDGEQTTGFAKGVFSEC